MADNICSFDLDALTTLYKDNPHILGKLQSYLNNLPAMLEADAKKYDDRLSKYHDRVSEQDQFYQTFLNKHQYYYMRNNNTFYEYDGNTYRLMKEDDVHYHLLSTITDERRLVQWKHKTKQSLLKKIRERDLFTSIPNTTTIQTVLGFIQGVFETKQESKYFLTALGDCILKKNSDSDTSLVFFVTSTLKKIIAMIDSIVSPTIGFSIAHNFISKYHELHKISTYRLIKSNDGVHFHAIKSVLNDICIDLMCVSVHYSMRYGGSADYLTNHTDTNVQKHALFFTTNSVQNVVDDFIKQYIDISVSGEDVPDKTEGVSLIQWKDMHYLWKSYLNGIRVPNMVYSHTLQLMLVSKLNSKTNNGALDFLNVSSNYLPHVAAFLTFWEKYITIQPPMDHDASACMGVYEYEIDELVVLYKKSEMNWGTISEDCMSKLIHHYFSPEVQIVDSKYVTNISCSLWTKSTDIDVFLSTYKHIDPNIGGTDDCDNPSLVAIDDLYRNYTTYVAENHIPLIVSKQYFFKYVLVRLSKYIDFDVFVQTCVFE